MPGDPSNLHSKDYIEHIGQAKRDLEVGPTKLDQFQAALEAKYRKLPGLRFLNLAPFMADDYASFKQALAMIDFNFRSEAEDSRETYEQRKAREALAPLLFGNTRRLIPLFKNRFPDPAEHEFLKQFAECMDDERDRSTSTTVKLERKWIRQTRRGSNNFGRPKAPRWSGLGPPDRA